jgi:hypothetical protein
VPDKILLVKAKVTTPVFDYIVCILLSALYVLVFYCGVIKEFITIVLNG